MDANFSLGGYQASYNAQLSRNISKDATNGLFGKLPPQMLTRSVFAVKSEHRSNQICWEDDSLKFLLSKAFHNFNHGFFFTLKTLDLMVFLSSYKCLQAIVYSSVIMLFHKSYVHILYIHFSYLAGAYQYALVYQTERLTSSLHICFFL